MKSTTIKVSRELRDRVQKHAVHRQTTQAVVLSEALDLLERQAFFEQLQTDVVADPETPQDAVERDAWFGGPLAVGDE